jgi:hypothetical protein
MGSILYILWSHLTSSHPPSCLECLCCGLQAWHVPVCCSFIPTVIGLRRVASWAVWCRAHLACLLLRECLRAIHSVDSCCVWRAVSYILNISSFTCRAHATSSKFRPHKLSDRQSNSSAHVRLHSQSLRLPSPRCSVACAAAAIGARSARRAISPHNAHPPSPSNPPQHYRNYCTIYN